jgi:hypothetical protein
VLRLDHARVCQAVGLSQACATWRLRGNEPAAAAEINRALRIWRQPCAERTCSAHNEVTLCAHTGHCTMYSTGELRPINNH